MLKVTLKKKADWRLKNGHLWVFSNELVEVPDYEPGSIVELFDSYGQSYGFGLYNPHSLISVRLLKTHSDINEEFFEDRIRTALEFRKKIYPNEPMFRLVFGESDFLPGLIIDKYDNWLTIQTLSAGMDIRLEMIITALLKVLPNIQGIIEKNISKSRELEGLPLKEGIIYGNIPEKIISSENGIKLNLDLSGSQKTGYFLDQRENRMFIRRISKDMKVLDCFCNQGGFALNAALSSSRFVLGIDSSEQAIETATENSLMNNFRNIEFQAADVFDFLNDEINDNNKWDIIILDPPAFAKNRKYINQAVFGYKKLNKLALMALNDRGYLVTSSCSQHIEENIFYDLIIKAALKTGKCLKLIYRGMQAPDHPILVSMPETKYLKFYIFQCV